MINLLLLAQTAPATPPQEVIQISLPIAITVGGILAILTVIIKLGDRLWGKKDAAAAKEINVAKEIADQHTIDMQSQNAAKAIKDVQDTMGDAKNTIASLRETCNVCRSNNTILYNEMAKHIEKLSDTMTKYAELQQASLKIEEYRHEHVLRQLEIIAAQVRSIKE